MSFATLWEDIRTDIQNIKIKTNTELTADQVIKICKEINEEKNRLIVNGVVENMIDDMLFDFTKKKIKMCLKMNKKEKKISKKKYKEVKMRRMMGIFEDHEEISGGGSAGWWNQINE